MQQEALMPVDAIDAAFMTLLGLLFEQCKLHPSLGSVLYSAIAASMLNSSTTPLRKKCIAYDSAVGARDGVAAAMQLRGLDEERDRFLEDSIIILDLIRVMPTEVDDELKDQIITEEMLRAESDEDDIGD